MTKQQEHTMKRILERKRCSETGRLLREVQFGIFAEEVGDELYYRLYRLVKGVRDAHALLSSKNIRDIHVYLGPANADTTLPEI